MPSGRLIKIEFQETWSKKRYSYNIYLVSMRKRKQEGDSFLKTYGQDGVLPLIWARDKIVDFEEFIRKEREGTPIFIYCSWDDSRRRDVYYYGLKKHGYEFQMYEGGKVLGKPL